MVEEIVISFLKVVAVRGVIGPASCRMMQSSFGIGGKGRDVEGVFRAVLTVWTRYITLGRNVLPSASSK